MNDSPKRIVVTDCEGPVTKNDNAAELAAALIPSGSRFFAKVSLYDDYLAEIKKKPGYKAGDTLKLILPFLKAYGLDEQSMERFSMSNISLIPQADEALRALGQTAPVYVVSTSYNAYVKGVCDSIGFPIANCYCTSVMIDKYPLSDDEKTELRDMAARIVDLPEFDLPAADDAHDSISAESWRTINELDAIFWERLPMMAIYKLVEEVNPIGGREKAAALEDIAAREGSALENIIYFGDSITDTEAFRLLNQNGGLSVSFNGNHWAVQEARLAITAQSALPMLWIASTFIRYGPRALEDLMIIEPGPENIHQVRRISSEIRKRVRTEVIGALG